jgi:hypothetical protein
LTSSTSALAIPPGYKLLKISKAAEFKSAYMEMRGDLLARNSQIAELKAELQRQAGRHATDPAYAELQRKADRADRYQAEAERLRAWKEDYLRQSQEESLRRERQQRQQMAEQRQQMTLMLQAQYLPQFRPDPQFGVGAGFGRSGMAPARIVDVSNLAGAGSVDYYSGYPANVALPPPAGRPSTAPARAFRSPLPPHTHMSSPAPHTVGSSPAPHAFGYSPVPHAFGHSPAQPASVSPSPPAPPVVQSSLPQFPDCDL